MSKAEIILFTYAIAGVIVIAGIFIYFRGEGLGRKAVEAASDVLLGPLVPVLALLTVLLWPFALLGILICWLDGKAVGETDNPDHIHS